MKTIKILVLILLITEATFGTIRYVSKTGSSTPPYLTWETASDSIQKCINICVDGDTIIVANGVYKEAIRIIEPINLFGSSMDSCIIDGGDITNPDPFHKLILINASSTIQGFKILRKKASEGMLVGIEGEQTTYIRNCFVTLSNSLVSVFRANIIMENLIGSKCQTFIGALQLYNHNLRTEVSNCVFSLTESSGGGVEAITTEYGNLIINNNILLNIGPGGWNTGNGIKLFLPQSCQVHNNLISRFSRGVFVEWVNSSLDTGEISNNLISNILHNPAAHEMGIASFPKIKTVNNILYKLDTGIYGPPELQTGYNMFWGNETNSAGGYQLGETDIIADPMFVNDSIPDIGVNYNYELQKYSPGIDAGDPSIPDVDGSRSDIGLYGGPFGKIYNYIDLPPQRPSGIVPTLIPDEKRIIVRWAKNSEADTSNYIVYKDTVSNFPMDSSHIFLTQKDTIFEDCFTSGTSRLYYRIKAVDKQGNMSEGSDEISFVLTDEGEYVTEVKRDYHLYQNYPNPFNPNTVIGYQLAENSYVKVMVYDIKGELLEVLVNENKPAGYYEVEFNAGKYASGIYLYRIEAVDEEGIPRFMDMKKMMLVK